MNPRNLLFVRGIAAMLCLAASLTAWADSPVANPEAVVTAGNARFTVLTPEMIRIEYSSSATFEDRATFVIQNRNLDVPQFSTTEDADFLYINTSALSLKYRKGSDPRTVPASPANLSITMAHRGNNVVWYPGKPDPLNLKGTCRTLDGCNADSKRGEMENGLVSRSGWAVIDDSWTASRPDGSRSFALELNSDLGFDWWAPRHDAHAMDTYFLGYGSDYKRAIFDFTRVAGKIPLPPDYVFGYWYSKYASYSADDYRQIMTDLKQNDVPSNVMILDMDWHWNGSADSQSEGIGGWTGWSWNTNLIPDPSGLLSDIHSRGFRAALNLHPADGVNRYESAGYYNAMNSDLNGKYNEGDNIAWRLDYPDFTKSFFNRIIRDHESEGVDFWWLDWQQYLVSYCTPGLGETFWCNHVFFNDMKVNRPSHRPVIFHRWGGLGSHRYQIGFSGDASINFPTLNFQPYFTATASNVGYTYWGHDIGGHMFTDEATVNDKELVLRWIQFGVFSPILRTHATKDDRIERRIWKFPNFTAMRDAVKLRYALFPYIYTMARHTFDTGLGLCRPLYYEYPDCEEAYKFENEYFFGNDILVAPITEPAGAGKAVKRIWFPEGRWWSVATNELIEGPCTIDMEFADNEIPYFFKQGSVIPFNPASVSDVTVHPDALILNVVAGADGTGSLYEDAGDNSDYATAFGSTAFTHTVGGGNDVITIEPRISSTSLDVNARAWTIKVFASSRPSAVEVNGAIVDGWAYDELSSCTSVPVPTTDCNSAITVTLRQSSPTGHVGAIDACRHSVIYDSATATLKARFSEPVGCATLSVRNLAGIELLSRSYSGVTEVSENLSNLVPAVYVCTVKADSFTNITKICK